MSSVEQLHQVALADVLQDQEPLLDNFSSPVVSKKVEACKEALYSALVGGAWGLATGLPLATLFYANSGVAECLAVGAVADTVASAVGAFFGTVVKNSLGTSTKHRVISALIAGYGASAAALSIYNATMTATKTLAPLWTQFAVGLPLACAGALAAGCTKPRFGRIFSGFLASAGTGCLTGVSLGKVLSIAMPRVGPRAGPMLGLLGVQGMCGYIMAADKFKIRGSL